MASFGAPRPRPAFQPEANVTTQEADQVLQDTAKSPEVVAVTNLIPEVASILNPVTRRIALVKLQGPWTDVQLESICRGMVYLSRLGLVSVIVVENTEAPREAEGERSRIIEETLRVTSALERQGARARPFLGSIVRLGPSHDEVNTTDASNSADYDVPEAHSLPSDLIGIQSAIRAGEIPVIAPVALDSFCRSVRISANEVVGALAKGMVDAAKIPATKQPVDPAVANSQPEQQVDLTPLRLMVITREGGVPSYARAGLPHLLINTTSEFQYINETFQREWRTSHPNALGNLRLARTCLHYMPSTSSAVIVSHRSPSSLIANLITNRPALSSSLPHAFLQGKSNSRLTPHTPTLIRRGQPISVFRSVDQLDKAKLTHLLEHSFRRTLDADVFYTRLKHSLDFVIVAGDYAGAAIVTRESTGIPGQAPVTYLDKFAVLPEHQGDGTVDFLWVGLHDESYGLGLPYSANPNGGAGGQGEGRDLVWRSRADNPINRWYFERSTGHLRMGDKWVLFWCDAEVRLKTEEGRRASAGLNFVEDWEEGRLGVWAKTIDSIPSVWKQ